MTQDDTTVTRPKRTRQYVTHGYVLKSVNVYPEQWEHCLNQPGGSGKYLRALIDEDKDWTPAQREFLRRQKGGRAAYLRRLVAAQMASAKEPTISDDT